MADTVYLGIDLGTSRTSITASTGVRETIWSYVGYPKDHVAKKKFGGRDVIFGKEAVENPKCDAKAAGLLPRQPEPIDQGKCECAECGCGADASTGGAAQP